MRAIAAAAVVTILAGPASARAAVDVSLAEEAPFAPTELDDAVRARVPDQGDVRVVVSPSGPGTVVVRVGDKAQVVEVGDRRGTAAARVVALVIADLIAAELVPAVAAAPADDAETQGDKSESAPDAPAVLVRDPAPVARQAQPPYRIAAAAGASKGIGAQEPFCARVDADVSRPLAGPFVVGAALGLVLIPTRDGGQPDELSYTAGVARVWAGWRAGVLGLGIGPFVSPYRVGGAVEHMGVLAGAGVHARVTTPLAEKVLLVAELRGDAYANRIHVTWPGLGGFATPRAEVALVAGLAWDTAQ
ncbi:MAG TPA: hypothetical protein VNR90_05700 [Vicinamibacterales bacterium]|nr:hypothetical protein [Vicinamibacterales bacterium]